METFLSVIAQDLLHKFGNNLSHLVLVFPNKRAGLFMNQSLASLSDAPVWAPRYQTISELFHSLSVYTECDPIQAICELYNVYKNKVNEPESPDRFYGWGEIMLADFDDLDKHRADAEKLFSNIQAIKALDDSSFLTPHQEEALQHFFEGFSIENNTRLKEKFLEMWNVMGDIYREFNLTLKKKNLLYEGALYRDVIEHLNENKEFIEQDKTYVFVGFNVLNEVEKQLFHFLRKKEKAIFYWDYDVFYVSKESPFEAGLFIRENLLNFPNELSVDYYRNFNKPKQLNFISSSSENAQARYLPQWLAQNITMPESETAVVLCNESLLQPVLHALPDKDSPHALKYVNVTMGFPLADTPVYSFVNALAEMQVHGYDKENKRFRTELERIVKNHPYASVFEDGSLFFPTQGNEHLLNYLNLVLEKLAVYFREQKSNSLYHQLYQEALFQTHGVINRFKILCKEGILDLSTATLIRLMREALVVTSIPFHGEPAMGLQVMGVLETRNLDFRHLVLLSVNEGKLPKHASDTSFIPHNLKEAFGLTTIKHKIAVYAFYFYRLIQRAERITFLYNTSTDGSNQGEMSRFLRQLLAETDIPIIAQTLQASQSVPLPATIEVNKTLDVMRKLQNKYDVRVKGSRPLSPSALNHYLDCPLKFYFAHVAEIKIEKRLEEEMDGATFGTLFHKSAEYIYAHLTEKNPVITRQNLELLLDKPEITLGTFVDRAFRKEYFKIETQESVKYNGLLLIVRKVIVTYLKQLLEYDLQLVPFEMKAMEHNCSMELPVKIPQGTLRIRIGGQIDRMDYIDTVDEETGEILKALRIVDYKTGGEPEIAADMEKLILPAEKRPHYIFQTFLYALVMCKEEKLPIIPSLFFVHKSYYTQENENKSYSPIIRFASEPVTNFHKLKDEFQTTLHTVLEELFNPDIPFGQTDIEKSCSYCDFKKICRK